MDGSEDAKKVLDAMLDPVTSGLISMLEGGSKTAADLSESSKLGEAEIHERFAPLVERGIIVRTDTQEGVTYSADADKLDAALSGSKHFDGTIDLVTQMDTFLN